MNREHMAKKLRELRGYIPRKVVAEELNISVSALSAYENGARVPSDDLKVRFAKYYKSTVSAIFFADENNVTCD